MFFTEQISTSRIGTFEASIKTSFSRKIKLPKMDNYPLDYFSQTRSNFLEAISKYPCLESVFRKLDYLQSACSSHTDLINWYSITLTKKLNQKTSYVQVYFKCAKEKEARAISFLDSLGIF